MKTVRNSATTWCKTRLGRIVYEIGGSTPSKERKEYWDGTIPWVSPKDMKVPRLTGTIDTVSERALRESALRLVAPGAVLLVVRGMILAHTVPVAINDVPVTLNQDMKALRPAKGVDSNFLRYRLVASQGELLGLVEQAGHGTCCLRSEHWKGLDIALPESVVQRAIADFLDRKTAAIDDLIAKKERLIELLQEKRQALITQAVTKGLDPSVPMKDSGVEWIGEVPQHWRLGRLRFDLASIEQGWSPQCDGGLAELDEWAVLKVGCVNGPDFDPSEHKRLPNELAPRTEYEIRPGDILMSRANTAELLGSAALVREVRPRLLLCDKLYRMRVEPRALDPEYIVLAFSATSTRRHFEREASGASSSMQNIGQDTIKNLLVPRPSLDEQRAIVRAVAAILEADAHATAMIHTSVTLLREYRQALITNAVTGQLDIPGAA